MFIDPPNYRSPSVNTDKFGLREQYDDEGQFIDLEAFAAKHAQCNVLLGGSTVFGVDATSDRMTLSHHLHRERVPCINLGFRAATGQQELIMFLLLKRYLGEVSNIVILSGVNDCALAARPGTLLYRGFGGIFYEGIALSSGRQQELVGPARYHAARAVDTALTRSRVLRGAIQLLVRRIRGPETRRRPGFEQKLEESMDFVQNTIDTWGRLQAAGHIKVHFVLQPAIGWTQKALTQIERECFDADVKLFPETELFSSQRTYTYCRRRVEASCKRSGIDFHDANEWLNDGDFHASDIFTDVCHLSDGGTKAVATLLRQRLTWRENNATISR